MVEFVIATGVAVLIGGTTMLLLIESAMENKRGFSDATVQQAASGLENNIMQILRSMSAGEGVVFASPTTNASGYYQSIIVAAGPAPDYPRQRISFDSASGAVAYNQNIAGTNATAMLVRSNSAYAVRLLAFSPTVKQDGTPDNSLVNVLIKMDDRGNSRRTSSDRAKNPGYIWRSFAVKMRNN